MSTSKSVLEEFQPIRTEGWGSWSSARDLEQSYDTVTALSIMVSITQHKFLHPGSLMEEIQPSSQEREGFQPVSCPGSRRGPYKKST